MPTETSADAFPFTVEVATAPGARLFRNDLFGITVAAMPEYSGSGERRHVVSLPLETDANSETEATIVAEGETRAKAAYAALWLRAASIEIGLGFHPDTRAASYTPPLSPTLAAQYDRMIDFCHGYLEDPYATTVEAWEEAGLISKPHIV